VAGASHRLLILFAIVAGTLSGCGSDGSDGSGGEPSGDEVAAEASALEPTEAETSIEEFLAADEVAASLNAMVDCGDQPGETLECTVTGTNGLDGTLSVFPSPGFQYTGEIEGPEGLSSLGGSSPEGSAADPPSVEASLNEVLADEAGAPETDCPDAASGDALECEVTGDGVSGTIEVTPIGGFEWEGQLETPQGSRAIAGNALP
jgi:hypothetical protein